MWGDSNQQMPRAPALGRSPVWGRALNEHTGTRQSSVKKPKAGCLGGRTDACLLHRWSQSFWLKEILYLTPQNLTWKLQQDTLTQSTF